MRKIIENTDAIIKWLGYIMVAVTSFFAIVTIVYVFTKRYSVVETLSATFCSFIATVSLFATYLVVRAAKVYLQKNGEFSEETCE